MRPGRVPLSISSLFSFYVALLCNKPTESKYVSLIPTYDKYLVVSTFLVCSRSSGGLSVVVKAICKVILTLKFFFKDVK
jgi:hypothetical protein